MVNKISFALMGKEKNSVQGIVQNYSIQKLPILLTNPSIYIGVGEALDMNPKSIVQNCKPKIK